MHIILSNSYWFIPLCICLGFGLSALLYLIKRANSVIPKNMSLILFFVRGFVLTLLAFLLLNPLSKHKVTELDKPVIFLLHDNSKSIVLNKDSNYYKGAYIQQWQSLVQKLEQDFQVRVFTFSNQISDVKELDFKGAQTHIEQALKSLEIKTAGINTGAIVLASDGIYTEGNTPLNRLSNFKAPFYTIGLGDTSIRKDWFIRNVISNKIAFTNSQIPVDIQFSAEKMKGEKGSLRLYFDGKKVEEKEFQIKHNTEDFSANYYIQAKSPGIYPIKAELSIIDGEQNIKNNSFTLFIEVTDTRKKIALLAEGPHPDLGAIKQSLLKDENYEVDIKYTHDFNVNEDYNLIVLHSIPGNNSAANNLFTTLKNKRIPTWFILGEKTSAFAFNNLQTGLQISARVGKTEDTRLEISTGFSGFSVHESMVQFIKSGPPLQGFPGQAQAKNNAQVLATKRIGSVDTKSPLWVFTNENGFRNSVLAAEGLWRLRMFDYEQNANTALFDEWIQKTIQILAASDDKSKFRVDAKNKYEENEPVYLRAEVYNDALESITQSDVQISILDSSKQKKEYTFSKENGYYKLDVGKLEPGVYTYEARTQLDGKKMSKSGSFIVHSEPLEYVKLRADHDLLKQISLQSKGEFYTPLDMEKLANDIKNRKEITIKSRTFTDYVSWIDWKWLFFFIIALISIEWFTRKWFGTY